MSSKVTPVAAAIDELPSDAVLGDAGFNQAVCGLNTIFHVDITAFSNQFLQILLTIPQ